MTASLSLGMGDAWIYTQRAEAAEPTSRMLAELGFSPRRIAINGSLRPVPIEGDEGRRPDLALLVGGDGDVAPLYTRLRDDEELGTVPIVVNVEPDGLALSEEMLEVHELIVSPFTAAELSARIARARRVVRGVEEHEVIRDDGLELNLAAHEARLEGSAVDFTYMEYELLKFLVTHPQRAFSREALLRSVWGYEFFGGARTVDVHVRRVRVKLGDRHAARLRTVRRVGYRWEP
ncbi:MAG TPA: winged helix-turn-helix domain-containing protein [Solirubrobacteraceae bacterium]|jgi:DNA-binding response OmpR family regulator